jgi:hypothetical protein
LLVRRCSAFVGVSATAPVIENGAERLGLGHPPFTAEQVASLNARTCRLALDRVGLRKNWQQALASGTAKQMTDGLRTEKDALPGGFILTNTIAALLVQAWSIFLTVFFELMRNSYRVHSNRGFFTYAVVVTSIAVAVSLPWSLKALWRFIRHGTPEWSLKQIGRTLLEALEYEGTIDRHAGEFRVYVIPDQDGTVFCWIGGGTGREQTIYMRALREALRPVDNPRYLLARKRWWRIFREDYFAVPEVLARKKEFAEEFARQWRRRVGPVELIYTRTPEGRKLLLRARMHSLASAFQKRSERVSCWK